MDYTIRIGGRHDKHGPRNSNEEEPMETANDRNSAEALDPARIGEAVYRAVRGMRDHAAPRLQNGARIRGRRARSRLR